MKTRHKKTLNVAISSICLSMLSVSMVQAEEVETITEAISSGKAKVDFRLRYEGVDQDNPLDNASALTLRTRLGYTTGSIDGFSATVEMEDNRIVLGQGDYTVGPTGYNLGQYSVIADPEFTELDQGFIQYKSDTFVAKVGRQVITHDGHRFIGHVGWRQDRQTFDALSVDYKPAKGISLKYAYVDQRNRIFGESADLDAKDHFLNASYKMSAGTLVGYAYLLEVDNDTVNGLDTYGMRFTGNTKMGENKVLYTAEYATQTSESAAVEFDADYIFLEAGIEISGVTAKLGYESLGSDNGEFGFATPLATLHKFNGWTDQFLGTPAQGLIDVSATLSGKAAGGKWLVVYHDFQADEKSETIDDLGSEINIQYTYKYSKNYSGGIKYGKYSGDSGRVDADKLWAWVSAVF
jgi:putative salt-induced outer membrane protein YdiY